MPALEPQQPAQLVALALGQPPADPRAAVAEPRENDPPEGGDAAPDPTDLVNEDAELRLDGRDRDDIPEQPFVGVDSLVDRRATPNEPVPVPEQVARRRRTAHCRDVDPHHVPDRDREFRVGLPGTDDPLQPDLPFERPREVERGLRRPVVLAEPLPDGPFAVEYVQQFEDESVESAAQHVVTPLGVVDLSLRRVEVPPCWREGPHYVGDDAPTNQRVAATDGDRSGNRTVRRWPRESGERPRAPCRPPPGLITLATVPGGMTIEVETTNRLDVVDVTDAVAGELPDDADRGLCTVFVPHTTAGVVVNEDERRLLADVERALDRLVPRGEGYAHDEVDDNADAHLRAMLLGEHVSVPVVDGSLALGTWQSVLFVECDGPRTRTLEVTVTPAGG